MQFKQSDFEIETNLEYKKFKMLPKKCKSNSCYSNRTIYQGLSVILLLFIECNHAFNLSPHPHIVLREPTDLKSFMTKTRSSYFGFSINLKRDSIFVGAPQAQSTLESQRKINETGAIYKCDLETHNNNNNNNADHCIPFSFDTLGNTNEENNAYTYNSEKKDHQWLGAAMDGNEFNTDKMVVCAPRLITDVTSHHLLHGVCYWSSNTTSQRHMTVHKISPLRLKEKQYNRFDKETYFYYMFGEQGISVHITANNEEILMGAPGIFTWKGSVIRHRSRPIDDLGGLSRRDQHAVSIPRHRRQNNDEPVMEYVSEIPNPYFWEQEDNSYFGFAVSSGFFDGRDNPKMLYVASAPQANLQQGEVYIFDIVNHFAAAETTIKKYHTFSGQQIGEYFGYSLLTEDFDNDGYPDIAIGAPLHSKDGTYENGAVYVYRNLGSSSNFILHAALRTEYEASGRFGLTMTKVGDINQDGYNDIAIAAPFEGNGAVYIYHGSANGLSSKASQRLAAPLNDLTEPFAVHMFGHGLSKGVDIDGNNFNDLAIGAPNAESVYVYKSYPVVRLNVSVTPLSQEIKTTDKLMKMRACWSYNAPHAIDFPIGFHAVIKIDGQLNRAMFSDKTNQYGFNATATMQQQCREMEASITFSLADIFKPIEIEMTYMVTNQPPQNDSKFCDTCVAVNPNDAKVIGSKVVFSSGCKSSKCVADLKVTSKLVDVHSLPYILGSSSSINLEYTIENARETAYLAQILVTIPETIVSFLKTPSNCHLVDEATSTNKMLCDVNNRTPLSNGDKGTQVISIDTTKVDGINLVIKAEVFSTGDEYNNSDNNIENNIPLAEFSDVEVLGDSSKGSISLENGLRIENISHTFEIRNNGPSNIKSVDVVLSIPIYLISPWSLEHEKILDFNNLTVKARYDKQWLDIEWSQNNTILIPNAIEVITTPSSIALDNYNGMHFDASRIGLEYDLSGGGGVTNEFELPSSSDQHLRRRRRSTSRFGRMYNPYLQRRIAAHEEYTDAPHIRTRRGLFDSHEHILNNLPPNRTIHFDCVNAGEGTCVQAKFTVFNFKPSNVPILVSFNFSLDLNIIDQIVTEKRDIFVMSTSVQLNRLMDEKGETIKLVQTQPYTIISKYLSISTPIWVYIVSSIFGLLMLILITYGLYRFGFFKRTKHEELVQLKRQSQAMANYQTEDEDENPET